MLEIRITITTALILCLTCFTASGPEMACAQQTLEAPPAEKQSEQAEQEESEREQDEKDPNQDSDEQKSKDDKVPFDKDAEEIEQKEESKDEEKSQQKDGDKEDKDKAKEDEKEQDNSRRRRRSRRQTNLAFTKQSEQFVSAFAPVVKPTRNSIVKILDDKKQVALGTIIDADGLILTKASELRGELKCEMVDGSKQTPTIVGIDPSTDLVLLKVEKTDLKPASIDEVKTPAVGSWLATVGLEEKPVAIGIVSHDAREIMNNVPNSAFIGIEPQEREERDGVRINSVTNDTPAERSGLLVNDIIIGIDDMEITNRPDLFEALSHYQPSDDIILKIKRGKEIKEVPLTLGSRRTNPMMNRGNQQNRMGSVLSKRKSDFPLAMQHDTALNANQIGGPVVDLNGKVVGINIARDGRVSSLALPIEIVLPIVEKLKTGEFLPEVVNQEEIKRVEKQLATLDKGLELLPDERMEKELEKSAAAAREDELERQIKEVEDRLQKLRERYRETAKTNQRLKDSIKRLTGQQDRYEDRLGPLKKELERLKSGVQQK